MKRIKRTWLNIPRKTRIAIDLLAIFLLGFGVYVFCGCPAFTAEQRYRRAEKANFVGPAEILTICDLENWGYQHLLVADDKDGVIFYMFSEVLNSSDHFVYREKTGDLTVLAAPDLRSLASLREVCDLPVFLFDERPEAHRAELEFTLNTTLNDQYFEKDYLLESIREDEGYFWFNIHAETGESEAEGLALQEFSRMSGYSSARNLQAQPVTVRLYDEKDDLILEEEILVRCVAGMAHSELESAG